MWNIIKEHIADHDIIMIILKYMRGFSSLDIKLGAGYNRSFFDSQIRVAGTHTCKFNKIYLQWVVDRCSRVDKGYMILNKQDLYFYNLCVSENF